MIVLAIGLPAAIFLTFIIARFVIRLLSGTDGPAKIAVTLFLVANLSNNALATKTPDVMLLTVLIMAFRPQIRMAKPTTITSGGRSSGHDVLSTTSSRPARLSV